MQLFKYAMLFFLWGLFIIPLKAQKENNMWYFSYGLGLNFNTTPPTALSNGVLNAFEGCSSVSDKNGNLLFGFVFDKTHKIMQNGADLKAPYSSSQAALIIPLPGNTNIYYLFTVEQEQNASDNLYYNIIDITKNSGKGAVISKNIALNAPGVCEKLTAVRNCDGDFWVLTHAPKLGTFYAFHFDNNGVNINPVKSKTGKIFPNKPIGYLKASPDGQKLAAAFSSGWVELYDFDKITGVVSNCQVLETTGDRYYGVSFSPNNKYLYITHQFYPTALYQYDVSLSSTASIIVSRKTLYSDSLDKTYGALQTGPDGRIYLAVYYSGTKDSSYIGVIKFPNSSGASSGFIEKGILLKNRNTSPSSGLPNLIENSVTSTNIFELGNDTILCEKESLIISGPQINGNFLWSTGDTTKMLKVNREGMYKLTISSGCGTYVDSISVRYGKPFKVYLGNDTAFCGAFSYLLNAGKGGKQYHWSTGDTTIELLVDKPNMYAVAVKDSNSCPASDTIDIDQLKAPKIDVRLDTVNCQYVFLSIPAQATLIKYNWSTGDTSFGIRVTQKGLYWVKLSNPFCSVTTTITVDKLPTPEVDLGPDTSICDGLPIKLSANTDADIYNWSTKETSKEIWAKQEGFYWIKVTQNNCSNYDTVFVGPVCDMWYYISSAFTPGRDAKNDVFEVKGENITFVDMQIFNRWGECIYSGVGARPKWDGTFKSVPCMDGKYMYIISVKGYRHGRLVEEFVKGSVTLLR